MPAGITKVSWKELKDKINIPKYPKDKEEEILEILADEGPELRFYHDHDQALKPGEKIDLSRNDIFDANGLLEFLKDAARFYEEESMKSYPTVMASVFEQGREEKAKKEAAKLDKFNRTLDRYTSIFSKLGLVEGTTLSEKDKVTAAWVEDRINRLLGADYFVNFEKAMEEFSEFASYDGDGNVTGLKTMDAEETKKYDELQRNIMTSVEGLEKWLAEEGQRALRYAKDGEAGAEVPIPSPPIPSLPPPSVLPDSEPETDIRITSLSELSELSELSGEEKVLAESKIKADADLLNKFNETLKEVIKVSNTLKIAQSDKEKYPGSEKIPGSDYFSDFEKDYAAYRSFGKNYNSDGSAASLNIQNREKFSELQRKMDESNRQWNAWIADPSKDIPKKYTSTVETKVRVETETKTQAERKVQADVGGGEAGFEARDMTWKDFLKELPSTYPGYKEILELDKKLDADFSISFLHDKSRPSKGIISDQDLANNFGVPDGNGLLKFINYCITVSELGVKELATELLEEFRKEKLIDEPQFETRPITEEDEPWAEMEEDSAFLRGSSIPVTKNASASFYQAFRKTAGMSLAELAAQTRKVVAEGREMTPKQFKEVSEDWYKKINNPKTDADSIKYHNVECSKPDSKGATTTTITLEGGNTEKIEHSYENGCPKVKMTNPPDDQSIMLFMESGKEMAPLKLQTKCDPKDALRLFEASVISGTKIELHEDNKKELADHPRYKDLKALQADPVALKKFREKVKGTENYKLGSDDIPKPEKEDIVFKGNGGKKPTSSP